MILVATVTANGRVLLAENMQDVAAPAEALGVFAEKGREAGCMIMGRSTHNMIMQVPGMKEAYGGIELVVLSGSRDTGEGPRVAASPEEALDYLRGKGYGSVVVAGGVKTYNAFLAGDLVTDMFLSVVPVVISGGGLLSTGGDRVVRFCTTGERKVTGEVMQLHFSKG